jgi:hypothetical protein
MLLKIKLNKAVMVRDTGDEITLQTSQGHAVELTTHYQEGKPEIQKLRLFVTDYGRMKRGG